MIGAYLVVFVLTWLCAPEKVGPDCPDVVHEYACDKPPGM